ncbi:Ig-like domain-containing protein [Methanosphaera stadtmanae]|uniref:Ig-like domain-containing protein n=1 Tax=Methanosphaera stadtmanae TaxID=2317 RepID=UPI002E77F732|nr:Ig-like domain-containing protein [Methanosphaera stadtmanae]MEE0489297.1 Ig-like domain-containing protein [Methanosphaera stadtmanae]
MSMILLGISAVSAENTTHSITDTPTVSTSTADMSKTVSTKTVAENTEVSENTYINHAKTNEVTHSTTQKEVTQKSIKTAQDVSSTNKSLKGTIPTRMSVTNKITTYNTKVQLTATVVNNKTNEYVTEGNVTFKINNSPIATSKITNGKAHCTYNPINLTPKKYTITAIYSGTHVFKNSSATGTLTVTKKNSNMVLSDKVISYGNKVQLIATITDKNTKSYVSNGKVAFKVNDKTVGYGSVSSGKAYYTYDSSKLSAKSYKLSAVFGETSQYLSSKDNALLTINKLNSTISLADKSVLAGNKIQLVATITNKNNNAYISNGKVAFKVNGKTIGYGSVSSGKAYYTYNTAELDTGKYKLTATYGGNNIYSSSTATTKTLTVLKNTFTYTQIRNAAISVRNQFESNKIVSTVTVGSTTMGLQDFLPLMIHMAKNVYQGKSSTPVEYKHYAPISKQTDSMKSVVLSDSQVLNIGNQVLNYYQSNSKAPEYITTSWGKFGYYNIVYTYTKMIDVSTSKYLPSSCKIYNWNTIHPTNVKSRLVVISTDNIFTTSKDKAFVNSIKKILESKGFTVKLLGVGPNTHNAAIWEKSLPDNAIQLSVFGGADAGVIYDVCTRSFMRAKANRLVFFAYHSATAKDITGLDWLERAHDDNYSPSSFKGIAHPDTYLKSHGYDYVYTSNVNTIVDALLKYVSG